MKRINKYILLGLISLFVIINSINCYCDNNPKEALRHAAQQYANEAMILRMVANGSSDFTKNVTTPMNTTFPSGVGFAEWQKNKVNTSSIRLFCDEITYPFSYTNFRDCSSTDDLWVKLKISNNIKHANWTCTETIYKYQKRETSNNNGTHTTENESTTYKTKKQSCKQSEFKPNYTFRFGRAFKDAGNFEDPSAENYIISPINSANIQMTGDDTTNTGSLLSYALWWTPQKNKDKFDVSGLNNLATSDFSLCYYITGELGKDELSSVKEIKAYGPDVEAATPPEDSETTSGEEEAEFEDTDFTPEEFGKVTPEEWWTELKESTDGKTYLEATTDTNSIFTMYSDVLNIGDYLTNEDGIANIKEWSQLPSSMQNYLSNYYENTVWPNSDGYEEYDSYINETTYL